mmetsp:Transcript_12324/g.37767  ORF Transcript_12324/g.37767 Transcript_12324/m.37767 type:complete len:235 (+) Transcript_12324:1488-2192(+)
MVAARQTLQLTKLGEESRELVHVMNRRVHRADEDALTPFLGPRRRGGWRRCSTCTPAGCVFTIARIAVGLDWCGRQRACHGLNRASSRGLGGCRRRTCRPRHWSRRRRACFDGTFCGLAYQLIVAQRGQGVHHGLGHRLRLQSERRWSDRLGLWRRRRWLRHTHCCRRLCKQCPCVRRYDVRVNVAEDVVAHVVRELAIRINLGQIEALIESLASGLACSDERARKHDQDPNVR